jgi:hypothetical protein
VGLGGLTPLEWSPAPPPPGWVPNRMAVGDGKELVDKHCGLGPTQ